ncbi:MULTISPECIES: AraC family transcriptional regulator [Sphingomonas]|jgi:AraC-like DNA-binding protein|uniref:AraC family transcriptional regulator n=1 Tax=Sphingomonas zeae TaxID=1646122 RepID=A0A7Y6B329_9SPHN|nr:MULTISPECIES: AraC family transcriptional regulator [Sphingomonas]MBB4050001.1 AraC-like DNA-binding protein [Sphingomonas zeae]MDK8184252.1 AraC family transcriptional regulator ligand-binding domain-containing protein [Sphingomonas zeae]MDK8214658.1 AraC family transcriptional regulator ligand-binding domain-containing protein [Sphingomonas sp. UMB7805-LC452B]NUU45718.1 AraC family transcriptional regulator [Sphingomonas zeae]
MPFWNFARSTASVRLMTAFGAERGLSLPALLAGTRLGPAQILDPKIEITAEQELQVVSNLLGALGDPVGLGIEVGQRYRFSTYGLWGYGLISSATGLDAISLALRFLSLTYAYCAISFHQDEQIGVLQFSEPGGGIGESERSFLLLRDMAAAATLESELVGKDFTLRGFDLRSALPMPGMSLFGAWPTPNCPTNSITFDIEPFRRPLPNADPVTTAMCEQMCSQLMERRRGYLRMGTLVRQYLSTLPANATGSLPSFADYANTSERTIKRRLHDEGTSFRQISADYRRAIADELLDDGTLNLADIAERLGFSDASSFSQAYKKWSGAPPSLQRRRRA